MKLKKLSAAILAGAMALSLVACGGGSANSNASTGGETVTPATQQTAEQIEENMAAAGIQTPNTETGNTTKSDETLVVELGSYPDYFWHPAAGQSGANEEQIINSAFLDRLVDLDENTNEVKPMLAESWEVNGSDITFKLRSGVKFTDGTELCADDVVYTVGVWMENCASNDTGAYLSGVEKVDDMTVTIKFNSESQEIIKMLSWANFGIVSESEVEAAGGLEAVAQNPVIGTGKYRFKEAKTGEYVILERNEEYWDSSYAGYFKEIKFTFVSDANSAISAIMSGDAQAAYGIAVDQSASFAEDPSVRVYLYSNGEVEHLMFNVAEGHPTSDIKVRQALAKALNYEAITAVATAGFGNQAYSYTASNAPYYVKGWTDEERAIDVEGAKALLAEAGYDESNPLKITCVTLADQVPLYTVIQENFREIGVELDVQQVDMGGFVPAMLFDKSYDIVAIGDGTTTRSPQLPQFVRAGMCFGGPGQPLPEHEEVLNRLMAAASDDEAKTVLEEYQNLLKEDASMVNLFEALVSSVVAGDIKGFHIRERGYIDVTTMYK